MGESFEKINDFGQGKALQQALNDFAVFSSIVAYQWAYPDFRQVQAHQSNGLIVLVRFGKGFIKSIFRHGC